MGGVGAVMPYLYFLRGPSKLHSPTHSSVQYISNHPSLNTLQPPKYHTCSVTYLKSPNKIYDFIYRDGFIRKDVMGMGEKTRKKKGNERKKNPRLVALPSPLLQYGGRLFSNDENKADRP